MGLFLCEGGKITLHNCQLLPWTNKLHTDHGHIIRLINYHLWETLVDEESNAINGHTANIDGHNKANKKDLDIRDKRD